MHEARRWSIQRNPRDPAYCETGRPYLGRTSGLGRASPPLRSGSKQGTPRTRCSRATSERASSSSGTPQVFSSRGWNRMLGVSLPPSGRRFVPQKWGSQCRPRSTSAGGRELRLRADSCRSLFSRGMTALPPRAAVRRATQLDSCQPAFNKTSLPGTEADLAEHCRPLPEVRSSAYCLVVLTAPRVSHLSGRRRLTRLCFERGIVFVSRHVSRDCQCIDRCDCPSCSPRSRPSRLQRFGCAGGLAASGVQRGRFKSHCRLSFQYRWQDHGVERHQFPANRR
jgi:hypothetical protein